MSMDLAKKTFSTQPDYLIAGTAEIVTAASLPELSSTTGAPRFNAAAASFAAVTVSGGPGTYKTEATGLYGILAEDVKSGEQGVVYLSGEFFADALVLPANGSAADLEVPFRALGIFLK